MNITEGTTTIFGPAQGMIGDILLVCGTILALGLIAAWFAAMLKMRQ